MRRNVAIVEFAKKTLEKKVSSLILNLECVGNLLFFLSNMLTLFPAKGGAEHISPNVFISARAIAREIFQGLVSRAEQKRTGGKIKFMGKRGMCVGGGSKRNWLTV